MIREGARAGTERAKAEGVALGRPSIENSNAGKLAIKVALAAKKCVRRIAGLDEAGGATPGFLRPTMDRLL
jgi:hypothetical protein